MSRSWTRIVGGLAAVAMLIVTVIGPVTASGGGGGAYKAVVAPSSIAAGTSVATATQQVLTLTQLASGGTNRVGSFRILIPNDLTVSNPTAKRGTTTLGVQQSSGSLTVNSVGFTGNSQTVKVTMSVTSLCGTTGDRTWQVRAQNATTFTAAGVDLAQDAASQLGTTIDRCSLQFVSQYQPASAARTKVITSEVAAPGGAHIRVRVLDANGAAADAIGIAITLAIVEGTGASGATLGGDVESDTNANGVANDFAPTINKSERGYKLRATADNIAPDTSAEFEIYDDATKCTGGPCDVQSTKGATSAALSIVANDGVLTLSVGLDQDPSCYDPDNHFYETTSDTVTWNITSSAGRVEATIIIDSSEVTRPYNLYDVCFVSPTSGFRNRYNIKIKPNHPGLLKICPPRLDPEPCVLDKQQLPDGSVKIVFSVPVGDPRGRV
jgi:hypothetical protein